jgi:hypothetical protein
MHRMAAFRIRQACARKSDGGGDSDNGKCSKHDCPFSLGQADNYIIPYKAIANVATTAGEPNPERGIETSDGTALLIAMPPL